MGRLFLLIAITLKIFLQNILDFLIPKLLARKSGLFSL